MVAKAEKLSTWCYFKYYVFHLTGGEFPFLACWETSYGSADFMAIKRAGRGAEPVQCKDKPAIDRLAAYFCNHLAPKVLESKLSHVEAQFSADKSFQKSYNKWCPYQGYPKC